VVGEHSQAWAERVGWSRGEGAFASGGGGGSFVSKRAASIARRGADAIRQAMIGWTSWFSVGPDGWYWSRGVGRSWNSALSFFHF